MTARKVLRGGVAGPLLKGLQPLLSAGLSSGPGGVTAGEGPWEPLLTSATSERLGWQPLQGALTGRCLMGWSPRQRRQGRAVQLEGTACAKPQEQEKARPVRLAANSSVWLEQY